MAMGKAVDGDNAKVYLETTLGSALDKIDASDHSGTTKGIAITGTHPGLTSITTSGAMTSGGLLTASAAITVTTGNLSLTAGSLNFGSTSKILPGATNFSLRNNADSADNILITDAGIVTIRAGLTVTTGTISLTGTYNFANAGVGLGGGAAPTLGTIGGSGPASAGQSGWFQMQVAGVNSWLPYWR